MATGSDDHDRAAAGMDFDVPFGEKVSELGTKLAEEGPQALFEEVEKVIPEAVRDQIQNFPIVAMLVGVGVGIWLGMRKGEEVIAAATSMATAAAMTNVNKAMERFGGGE